jgi:RNA polymerase sigma-70 factor (ECF subfamily)
MEEQVIRDERAKVRADEAVHTIELYRERLFRLALAIVADRELAEDVAQETLARAFRHRGKLAQVESVEAWLRTICVRQAINALRNRRETPATGEPPTSQDGTLAIAVEQVLARLSPDHSVVLALVLYEGLSYGEVADLLGIPEGTVASRLSAAKAEFRRRWEGAL